MSDALTLWCSRCNATMPADLYWHPLDSGAMHLGARCAACEKWIKWLPQTTENLDFAPLRPNQ